MRYFTVFLFCLFTTTFFAQQKIQGVVRNEYNQMPINNVSVINLSNYAISKTNQNGEFEIEVKENDIVTFTQQGFKSLKLTVTHDWLNTKRQRTIYIKEDVEVLDEIVINNLKLTGILQIDSRLIAFAEFPYTKDLSMTGFTPYTGFNPIDRIYRSAKKNSETAKKIAQLKDENNIMDLMKSRYDRELVSTLTDLSKIKIIETLQACNYNEEFIYTSSDYQIFTALNQCLQKQ